MLQAGTLRHRRSAPIDAGPGSYVARPASPFDFAGARRWSTLAAACAAERAPVYVPGPLHWSRTPAPGELDRLDALEFAAEADSLARAADSLENERLAEIAWLDREAAALGLVPRELRRQSIAKTRKDHSCGWCRDDIAAGETAEAITVSDCDGVRTLYQCYGCQTGNPSGLDGANGPLTLLQRDEIGGAPDGSVNR